MSIFEEVKNLISLEQVAKHYGIVFDGKNKAICPFHDDHKPSLSLHPDKKFAKCFPCGESFDSLEIEYRLGKHPNKFEAAKALNKRYSLNIKMNEQNNQTKENKEVTNLLEFYCDTTHEYLLQNKQALEWLEKNKGITQEDIKKYKIGYTGKGWLASDTNPANTELALYIGLLNKNNSSFYDCFRNRIIFPILINGSIAGIWT